MARKATRNAQGGGTIRQRSDGRWEARYTVGIDPGTGKQIQKSVYAKTQKAVRQKLSEKIVELDQGTYFEPKKIKLSDWLDIWLSEYTGDKKYLTVKGYRAQCNTHIKPSLGAVALSALTPVMIQKFYNGLLNPDNGEKGLAPKSVRNVHGILSKALNQAVKVGYLRTNPCINVTLPRVEKAEVKPLTNEQVKQFIKITEKDETYGILLKVIVFTGLREAEAMGMTWDCVDFQKGMLTILCPQTVYNHFKKLAVEIGAPDATVHDLRHTYAVLSLQNGDDVKTVQGNLGHATAAFTLDVYGHVSEYMQQASADRMEQYIQSITDA